MSDRRSCISAAAALWFALGCGTHATVAIDAAPADPAPADTIQVRIVDRNDSPRTSAPIVVHRPDGRVLHTTTSGADGTAIVPFVDGGHVTTYWIDPALKQLTLNSSMNVPLGTTVKLRAPSDAPVVLTIAPRAPESNLMLHRWLASCDGDPAWTEVYDSDTNPRLDVRCSPAATKYDVEVYVVGSVPGGTVLLAYSRLSGIPTTERPRSCRPGNVTFDWLVFATTTHPHTTVQDPLPACSCLPVGATAFGDRSRPTSPSCLRPV